mmetsp:Transcript_9917/g.27678  ORF Transcript_9917/g.27678 Transcript_9917/m.27678 type:complete len:499 (-) Transcript_9917:460-1956(-)
MGVNTPLSTGATVFSVLFCTGLLLSVLFQRWNTPLKARLHYACGFILALNFIVFWVVPMVGQGSLFKLVMTPYLTPVYDRLDQSPWLRWFAERFIYEKPKYADFFATQILFVLNFVPLIAFSFYVQLTLRGLPWWAIAVFNFGWVGVGGRCVGTAYTMAHKEGHALNMYKRWIRSSVGNVFENWIGAFYGNVAYNFQTTHIALHHRLDGGLGDTLYVWDLDRSSVPDVLTYLFRGLVHMSGFSALYQFHYSPEHTGHRVYFRRLAWGVFCYWVVFPLVLYSITRSLEFWFWIILQPLLNMSMFIAVINLGFHGFIENDENGNRCQAVESITLIGGQDDYFGEDDHNAHHYHTQVFWRDLGKLQESQREEWAKRHASVFWGFDIFTFSVCLIFKGWDVLADRLIDYSGKMTREEKISLLRERGTRTEMDYTHLLYKMPPTRPRSYNPTHPAQEEEGSAAYRALLQGLAAFQHGICVAMEKGLPRMPDTETLISTKSKVS